MAGAIWSAIGGLLEAADETEEDTGHLFFVYSTCRSITGIVDSIDFITIALTGVNTEVFKRVISSLIDFFTIFQDYVVLNTFT